MCIASSILLLFINAFNLRLWYCKNPQKIFTELVSCTRKNLFEVFVAKHVFGKYEKSDWALFEFGYAYYIDLGVHKVIHLFTIKDYKPIVCHCLVMIVY